MSEGHDGEHVHPESGEVVLERSKHYWWKRVCARLAR